MSQVSNLKLLKFVMSVSRYMSFVAMLSVIKFQVLYFDEYVCN